MRLIFAGLPLAALLLHHDGHEIVYAAICRRRALGTRRLKRQVTHVAVVPDFSDPSTVARVREARPDLLVSWFWTKRIPRDVLAIPRFGAIGVHPSLLPRHRGPDPYFWAIDAGDEVTGVTVHRLEEDYDTGAIYAQRTLPIDPSWNAWTLAKRLDLPSLQLLREVVNRFSAGSPPFQRAQDEAIATAAPAPTEEDLTVRWNDASEKIARRVRAAAPWPGMAAEIGDVPVILTRVRVATEFPRALHPGEAAVVSGVAVVRTRDGALALLEGRQDATAHEHGEETPLDSSDLARLLEKT